MMVAPSTFRRVMQSSASTSASRNYFNFQYPHSHTGTNNAFNNAPKKDVELDRDFKEGDAAPHAHRQVRVFPDWYKPWTLNYTSDGYLILVFGVFALFGYSYINDICE